MGRRGVSIELPHIERWKDRHGRERVYYRPPGRKRVALPPLNDPAFRAAYDAAVAGSASQPVARIAGGAGSWDRLITGWYATSDFKRCKPGVQRQRRSILDSFRKNHGHRIVAQMKRQHIEKIIGDMAETPSQANHTLKLVRMMCVRAVALEWIDRDPTAGIKKFREGTYHTWTEAEIELFEARWPLGTRERTAFALHLFTGQRLGDVSRMTWRDYDAKAGTIAVMQAKSVTATSTEATKLTIPVHGRLRAVLEATPRTHLMILATAYGKGFTVNGFGGYMADAIGAAGVPDHCVTHGLRKAAARRLAEIGCSALEIMAITGHKSLKEAERYVRDADQKKRAVSAVARLDQHYPE